MSKDFELIDVNLIQAHPLQDTDEGYSTETDYSFLSSVETLGILQPVLVAKTDNGYMMVAGHRRLKAAKLAGFKSVPAIIKSYSNETLIEVDYLESNRQREKNSTEKKAEFFRYKQILSQIKQVKQNHHGKARLKNAKELPVTDRSPVDLTADNLAEISDFLERIGIDADDNFKSRDVLAKATGMSRSEVVKLTKVTDDEFMGNKQNVWEKYLPSEYVQRILESWYAIRNQYEDGEIDIEEAVAQIDELISTCEKKIEKIKSKNESKPKKPKPSCYLSLPITDNPNHEKEAAAYEQELSDKYEVVNPVKAVAKFEKKNNLALDWTDCMVHLIADHMPKCKYIAVRGDWQNSKGVRIEQAVAHALKMEFV